MTQQKKEISTLLAESFRTLAAEKPIEKITIKEITDGAGVIRVTFYNHFQDKYELLEWICRTEIVEPVRTLLFNDMQEEAMTFLFQCIRKNHVFYDRAVRVEGQNSFESIVEKLFAQVLTEYLEKKGMQIHHKNEWLTHERAGQMYAHLLSYILVVWIRSGMQVEPGEMVEIYHFVSSHSLLDLTRERPVS